MGTRIDEQVAEHGDGRGAGADVDGGAEPGHRPAVLGDHEPAAGQQVPDVGGIRPRPLLVLAGRDRDPGDGLGVGGGRVPDPDAGHGSTLPSANRPVAWPRPWQFDRTAPPG